MLLHFNMAFKKTGIYYALIQILALPFSINLDISSYNLNTIGKCLLPTCKNKWVPIVMFVISV